MTFPTTRTDVPREKVGDIVTIMLQNKQVGNVSCEEQGNGRYKVIPRRRS